MPVIRLQNETPEVYVQKSRDFQLLCRLYDCVVNGIQFDISTMIDVTNTRLCRTSMLPLLQTKLGFFTKKEINDSFLRLILECFPIMIKKKGSLEAVRYAINIFLKLNKISVPFSILYSKDPVTLYNRYEVPSHTIIISINATFQDTSILEELLKYILPFGVGYYFYFYSSVSNFEKYNLSNKAILLFTSYNSNGYIRQFNADGEYANFENDYQNRLINAVDTITVPGVPIGNNFIEITDTIPTVNHTYDSGDTSLFLGIYENWQNRTPNFVDILGTNQFVPNSIVIYNNEEYVYNGSLSTWEKLLWTGNISDKDNLIGPQKNEVVFSIDDNKYFIFNGNTWVADTIPLFIFTGLKKDSFKKVTFKIVNGTWGQGGSSSDIIRYYYLVDDNGNFSENGSAVLNPPDNMYPHSGSWNPDLPNVVTANSSGIYTFTCS